MPDATPLVIAIAAVGAVVAGATARTRPIVALGVLALLASLSRATVETPIGTMRLEQPAVAVVAVVLLVSGGFRPLLRLPRWAYAVAGCLAVYLAALALSSLLVAPDRAASLRLVAWWAISIGGGVVALALALRRPIATPEPLGVSAALKGLVGFAVAALFLVGGPGADVGIQDPNGILPRVHAFTWETNLYASYLAAGVPFGIELSRRRWRYGLVALALIVGGLPLGVTRGAYIGLAAGIAAYGAVWWWRRRTVRPMTTIAAVGVAALVVGLVAAEVLLPNLAERPPQQVTVSPGAPVTSTSPGGAAAPGGVAVTPSPAPRLVPYGDTLEFRLERIPPALSEIGTSPIIGLGAESFGQRHHLETGTPDHIAILGLAVLYESGIVGFLALTAALLIVLRELWRRSGDREATGTAAAFVASIVALVVAYEATNALHFAHNWLVLGAAIAVAAAPVTDGDERAGTPAP